MTEIMELSVPTLSDPKPVAYKTTNEIVDKSSVGQVSYKDSAKPKSGGIRDESMDASTRRGKIFASPDKKYYLPLGKDLVIGGSGTTPVAISSNFNIGAGNEEGIENVLWSPDGKKVVVTTRRGDSNGYNGLVVAAWLEGNEWVESTSPGSGDEPAHIRDLSEKALRWISSDTFEMQCTITRTGYLPNEPSPLLSASAMLALVYKIACLVVMSRSCAPCR